MFCHETYRVVPLQTDAERAAIEDKFRLAKLETKWHKSTKHNPENLGLFAYGRAKHSKRYCDGRKRSLEEHIDSSHELILCADQFQSHDPDDCTARSLLAGLVSKTYKSCTAADVVEPTKTYKSITAADVVESTKIYKSFTAADATPHLSQCHMRKNSIGDASCPYKPPKRTSPS